MLEYLGFRNALFTLPFHVLNGCGEATVGLACKPPGTFVAPGQPFRFDQEYKNVLQMKESRFMFYFAVL